MANNITPEEKITYAKIKLLGECPFFGLLLMNTDIGILDESDCKTAFTNGSYIRFNRDFLNKITVNNVEFVLLHEMMHIVLKHCKRTISGNVPYYHEIENIACDKMINSMIKEAFSEEFITIKAISDEPFMHLVKGKIEGSRYSLPVIYNIELALSESPFKQSPLYILDDHSHWGEDLDNDGMLDKRVKEALDKSSRLPSKIDTSCIIGRVKEIYDPSLDYKKILKKFLRSVAKDDYTFNPPDNRYSEDFFIPSFKSPEENCINLYVMADTSCSIGINEINKIFNEIKSIISQYKSNASIKLGLFNTSVYKVIDVNNKIDLYSLDIKGGGTNFNAVFNYLHEIKDKPDAILIYTDGFDDFPDKNLLNNIPLLWMINNMEVTPPYGITCRVIN